MTTIARLRGLLFITIAISLFSGCLVPEQFDATLNIKKDRTFTFKYDGILSHVLIRQAILAGGADNKNDPDIQKLERAFQEDAAFKKASYIGNGQFKVLCELSGKLDEPFYFLSKDLMILAVVQTSSDLVEVRSFAVTEKSQQELAALRMNINGKLAISTEGKVLSHNAKTVGLLGTYSWQISSPREPSPSMVIKLPGAGAAGQTSQPIASEAEKRNACINILRQIDGAKEQWALENRKTPGAAPIIGQIDQYIKGGHPKCPSGGTYSYNVVDKVPACSTPGHLLNGAPQTPEPVSVFDAAGIPRNKRDEPLNLSDPIAVRNECINHLRQIDGAKEQWALEKRKRTGTIPVVFEVDEYIRGGHPKCPVGGTYSYNAIDQPPTCSFPGHQL